MMKSTGINAGMFIKINGRMDLGERRRSAMSAMRSSLNESKPVDLALTSEVKTRKEQTPRPHWKAEDAR